ncbi:hypothetical protein HY250_02925 [Candidatus Azambacteria bacterium]|nr:hypothetical protein [Candidatus Azambacteria bacterium]MBI3685332.1 hypothetical protein [Candidatus Azambacteria bacterium]
MTTKKIILILLAVLLLVGAGFAVYYFYFKKPAVKAGETGKETKAPPRAQENVTVIDSKLKRISKGVAVSPVAIADGTKVMYAGKSGGIYEVGFDGGGLKETKFVPQKNLFRVLWSKNAGEFIALYGAPEGRRLFYNNSATQNTSPLDKNIVSVSLSKTAAKMAYLSINGTQNQNTVTVADLNGENPKIALNTRLADVRLDWVNENEIAVSTTPSGLAENTLWLLNVSSQKLTSVLSGVFGLTAKWDDAGERFLFSQTSSAGENLSLSISNKTGGQIKKMDLAALPEKCTFSKDGKNVFCAAAQNAPDIVWPDDYYKGLYKTNERVWSVNLSTGSRNSLYEFDPNGAFDATNLILSPKEDALVFLNKSDGYLYSLQLK